MLFCEWIFLFTNRATKAGNSLNLLFKNVICSVTKILEKKKTRGVMQDTTQTTELVCIPTTSYKKIRK